MKKNNLAIFLIVAFSHLLVLETLAQKDPFEKLAQAAKNESLKKIELNSVKLTKDSKLWKVNYQHQLPYTPFEMKDKNQRRRSVKLYKIQCTCF